MPYKAEKSDRCPASRPWALIKKDGGRLVACHKTKEDAEAQARAIESHIHGK